MPTPTPQYASTYAQTGSGDVIFISVDGGTTFVQLMGTLKIAYSGQAKSFDDITSTTSVGNYMERKGTLKDPGKLGFDLVFSPTDPAQIALLASYDSDTVLTVKHVYKAQTGFSAGPINTFQAEVESDPLAGSDAGAVTKVTVSLQITGPITKTAAVPVAD